MKKIMVVLVAALLLGLSVGGQEQPVKVKPSKAVKAAILEDAAEDEVAEAVIELEKANSKESKELCRSKWMWNGNITVVFSRDRKIKATNGNSGTWLQAGGDFLLAWKDGNKEVATVSGDILIVGGKTVVANRIK